MNALDRELTSAQQGHCLNCGAPLGGPFCAACGQKARLNRSLAAFFSDLVAGLFNFESRFWRTLPMLAWCPGDLTRRYVEGQRARFISPIALYLFSVFLMFAALTSTTGGLEAFEVNGIEEAATEMRGEITALEQRRQSALAAKQPTDAIDRELAAKKTSLDDLQKVRSGDLGVDVDPNGTEGAPPWLVDSVKRMASNPREAAGNVQEAASKYSWALIPLSLPFMFLLFPFSRRHVFDHAVFVTYSLSFMMLLTLVGTLLVAAGASGWATFLMFVPPFHMYRQLKGAYSLRWWSALLRTTMLLLFSFVALSLFVAAVLALGLLA